MDAISINNLCKSFGDVRALRGLSLSVGEGELFGLVGPDGAGKTTAMRLLTGIMEPTSGEAWVAGLHIVRESQAIKNSIGYMSQQFGLYPDLTVIENIEFYADIYCVPRRGRQERINKLLGFSNLRPFMKRLAGNLSGGMKQKLGLACALIHTPRVLFLDEPTNGVDPVSRRDFWRILYSLLRERVTIFVSTSYLDEAERCNRLAFIHQGSLFALGTPDEVKRQIKGTLLEVRLADPRHAIHSIRQRVRADSVGLFGDKVHILTRDPEGTVADLRAMCSAIGAELLGSRVVEPSLEDLFLSVFGETPSAVQQTGSPHGVETPRHGTNNWAVTVEGLEKKFGDFTAVNQISFNVARGRIFGFLGPNGAGKSTTIRMLCGILEPSGGSGSVAGLDVRTQAERIKSHIGYMSQKFSLYDDLTVEQNIDFYSGVYRIAHDARQIRKDWVIAMSGLEKHRHVLARNLSGGWKQRLALGCAVLHQPPIVFLDEPTSGVDPTSRRRFWDLIYDMADRGVTVFVTTHYMDEADFCDELALIYRGEIIASGPPTILKSAHMSDAIVEILCERPQDALEVLEDLLEVKEVALFGNGLHAVTDDPVAAAAAIRRELPKHGFAPPTVTEIAPSLEDVFVWLIEAYDRTHAAQHEAVR